MSNVGANGPNKSLVSQTDLSPYNQDNKALCHRQRKTSLSERGGTRQGCRAVPSRKNKQRCQNEGNTRSRNASGCAQSQRQDGDAVAERWGGSWRESWSAKRRRRRNGGGCLLAVFRGSDMAKACLGARAEQWRRPQGEKDSPGLSEPDRRRSWSGGTRAKDATNLAIAVYDLVGRPDLALLLVCAPSRAIEAILYVVHACHQG
ncbi:hypothetical protein QBC39DRAFT_174917 [Podospora conica]|nr:hypothetical protein QBC39DRAFT_174917 [Schizothecium conicum]